MCEILKVPDLTIDPRFSNNQQRVKFRDELKEILTIIFEKESNDYWKNAFEKAAFPFGPVNNMQQVFDDPHVKDIGIVKTLKHSVAGDVKVVGSPVVYSDASNTARTAPPTLGQHTDDVLKSVLGYDEEKIHKLRSQKIIQ